MAALRSCLRSVEMMLPTGQYNTHSYVDEAPRISFRDLMGWYKLENGGRSLAPPTTGSYKHT